MIKQILFLTLLLIGVFYLAEYPSKLAKSITKSLYDYEKTVEERIRVEGY